MKIITVCYCFLWKFGAFFSRPSETWLHRWWLTPDLGPGLHSFTASRLGIVFYSRALGYDSRSVMCCRRLLSSVLLFESNPQASR